MQVCLSTNHLLWNTTLGGHAWVFLNWALGLKAAGAKVVLLEKMRWADDPQRLFTHLRQFYNRLGALGLERVRVLAQLSFDLHALFGLLLESLVRLDQSRHEPIDLRGALVRDQRIHARHRQEQEHTGGEPPGDLHQENTGDERRRHEDVLAV